MTEQSNRFMPIDSNGTPRFSGIATFMRLPHVSLEEARDVDIGLLGVPWDGGTTNRAGARHGPRQMRDQSSLMRQFHPGLGISPYRLANCADLGDTPVNPVAIEDTLSRVENFVRQVVEQRIIPLTAGGDHLISLPVLRALAERHGPLGMVHFDAHTDTFDRYFGDCKYTHGTPFRRAIEEGVLDPKRTIQIGIRGGLYSEQDDAWGRDQGIRVIRIEEYDDLGVKAVVDEIHRVVGSQKTYVSFDVDCLDPAYAPGTGTPEIGGLNPLDAQRMLRSLIDLNLVGGDVVEVSPPFDPGGNTALVAATMMWEILCVLAANVNKKVGL